MGVPIDRNDCLVQMLLDSIARDEQRLYNRIEALHLDMMSGEGLIVVDDSRACGWRVVDQIAEPDARACYDAEEAPLNCNGMNVYDDTKCLHAAHCVHYSRLADLSMHDTGMDADGDPLVDDSDCVNFREKK
jgi:hypothetical protein